MAGLRNQFRIKCVMEKDAPATVTAFVSLLIIAPYNTTLNFVSWTAIASITEYVTKGCNSVKRQGHL